MDTEIKDEIVIKWIAGMKLAIEKMILYKYRNLQSMVISTEDGIKVVSGEDLLKYLPIQIKIGSDNVK
ncbi:MAG: hypothetical protein ABJB16_18480 [Saprospiraceae bacterium]